MEITEVRIKLMEEPGERLQAFCSITFDDCFVIRDLKIIEGTTGPFVAMPSRKLTTHCPQCGCKNHLRASYCNQCGARLKEQNPPKDEEGRAKLYADIAHPINSACREMIQSRVIKAYGDEKARSKLPGYVPPKYDEYESDLDVPPADLAVKKSVSGETTQIQPAERPQGPHRGVAPQADPHAERPAKSSFGAGIFEQ